MSRSARLAFRRHLALCLLSLLAAEAFLSIGQFWPMTKTNSQNNDNDDNKNENENNNSDHNLWPRLTRVKLAWAAELGPSQAAAATNSFQPSGEQLASPTGSSIYQYDTNDDTNFIMRFLYELQDYLPVMNFNFTLNPNEDLTMSPMDVEVEQYYKEQWAPGNTSLDQLQLMAVKATLRTAPMPLHTSWGYVTRDMARLGSAPVQNEELCTAQLQHLLQRLDQALTSQPGASGLQAGPSSAAAAAAAGPLESSPVENFEAKQIYRSTDVDLFRYMDTFGRVPSDSLRGNVKWYGSYSACMTTRLRSIKASRTLSEFWHRMSDQQALAQRQSIKFRYCMGSLKSLDWLAREKDDEQAPKQYDYGVTTLDHRLHNYFIRVGLCLPEACDSLAVQRPENRRAIERLSKFQLAKPFNSDHYKYTDLYCLPDKRSPLRALPLLGKLLILAILGWLGLIGLATMIHLNVDKFYTKTVEQIRAQKAAELAVDAQLVRERQQRMRSTASTSGSENEFADEWDQLNNNNRRGENSTKASRVLGKQSPKSASIRSTNNNNNDDDDNRPDSGARNEFEESDFLQLKLNWIKLNVWARDKSRTFIPGVDLVDCLSLYSNWLRYTSRVKLAVVRLYAHEQLNERKLRRNERLLPAQELARAAAAAAAAAVAAEQQQQQKNSLMSKATNQNQNQPADGDAERRAEAGRRQLARWEEDDKIEAAMNLLLASGRSQATGNKTSMEANVQLQSSATPPRVDTSSLNALKVIALLWIIAGHCLYYLGSVVGNGHILMLYTNQVTSFALANGAIYITELFFVVTGCLTAYLSFKYNTRLIRVTNSEDESESVEMKQQQLNQKSSTSTRLEITTTTPAPASSNQMMVEKQLMEPRMLSLPFWALVTANRYLRIVPTYLAVYAIIKLVTVYIGGEGNLWDYAVSENSVRRACASESWLPVLTLTTNFLDIYKHCIVGGWYLSVDFQFSLMAVPLLIVLAHSQHLSSKWFGPSGRLTGSKGFTADGHGGQAASTSGQLENGGGGGFHGMAEQTTTNSKRRTVAVANQRIVLAYGLILGAAFLSALLSILHAIYRSHVDLSLILKFTPHQVAMLSQNIDMYTNSIYRFRAFAFGLILGHCLYLYEFKLINLPKLVQLHGTKLTTGIFLLGAGIMFIPVLYPMGKIKISHDMTSILTVLTASGIDIFLCTLIFLICIGKAPKAVLFVLNSPFWSIFSALSLSAFLIHTEVITLLTSQYDPPPNTTWATLLFLFCTTTMITYTLALGFYLTLEMPVGRLIDAIMQNHVLKWQPFKSQINANNRELEEEMSDEKRRR